MTTAPPPLLPEPSPTEAAREAYHHTIRTLFPFRLEVWGVLGFVAFLDQCGRGGIGGAVPGGPGGDYNLGRPKLPQLTSWMESHLALLIVATLLLLAVILGLVALALWIGSRATFVYLDDVARGRAELAGPWRRHAERAASYFAWRFGLALVLVGSVILLLLLGLLTAVTLSQERGGWGMAALVALVVFIPLFLAVLLGSGLLSMALRDFVAPLQVHQGLGCRQAAAILQRLVRQHPMAFFVYVVLKVVFGLVQGAILLVAACITCCCILVPVVTQTFLQPLFFFERAWSLFLLRQMGYDLFPAATTAPRG